MGAEKDIKQDEIKGSQNFGYQPGLICSMSSSEFILLQNNSSILREVESPNSW